MSEALTRRHFLSRTAGDLGLLALAGLVAEDAVGMPQKPHRRATAKSVIWLFMNGGASGFDMFDPKPAINNRHGQKYAGEIDNLFPNPGPIMACPFRFKRYGESGQPVNELMPELGKCVDDIAFLNATTADSKNHGPACYQLCSGQTRMGFPSVGSWVAHGLGSENRELPEHVVMYDHRSAPEGGTGLWDNAFLAGRTRGVPFRPGKTPLLYLDPPKGVSAGDQRSQLALLREMNAEHAASRPADARFQARLDSYELAFRMQAKAPKLVDLSRETRETRRLYGMEQDNTKHFGAQCLMARRMVEQGVRFIQVFHGGATMNWDSHQELEDNYRVLCPEIDKPIAGLLIDLKRRGLLDETLIVWAGEFGRLPISQNGNGRDHNPHGFVTWMAGGGINGGISHGKTDELGYRAVEGAVHIRDLHATILHCLGLDHEHLTVRHNGRDVRLTDTGGKVVRQVLR